MFNNRMTLKIGTYDLLILIDPQSEHQLYIHN